MTFLFTANAFSTVWNFFSHGGVFMLLLLLTSVVSIAMIIWRALALKRELVIPKALEEAVSRFTPTEHNLAHLLDVIKKNESPFARIVLQACRQFSWTKTENLTALQTVARKEVHHLESGLNMMEIITGIGPLLGLLGTVSGLITVFSQLKDSGSDNAAMAAGIAEALHCTIMGLAVAIPSLVAHSIFSKRVEWLAVDMEANIESLLAKCYHEPAFDDATAQVQMEEAQLEAMADPEPTPAAAPAAATAPGKTGKKKPATA